MSSKDQNTPNEQVLDENLTEHAENDQPEQERVASVEGNDLSEKIAQLEMQLFETQQSEKEAMLRAKAEVENMRRRTEQDIEKAHKFALEKFVTELLPVIDNLERALEVANQDENTSKPMIEGVELTLKSLLDAVHKFGVEVIEDINIAFNPELHQAMTMLPSADNEPNQVMMVMQKGYLLNSRLVRPAMVAVSKSV